ncbi:hypothetical protein K2173_021422 [Erythroxylum novogranatense]|uniref:Protein kinase domain-containing protein n=1 Tax=Erythroxylum novogranatense TaxID=1862640 RepID=A0AAV8TY51_9ROSI|nr:hypothetical protein K2173_021422 [Erythroxylum novogranatense]
MSFQIVSLRSWWRALGIVILVLVHESTGLNTDGILLLSFKYSILKDPLGVLQSWNYHDETPCSWHGVTCGAPGIANSYSRVTSLTLPASQLLGSIPSDLGIIEQLQRVDLSDNSLNGSLPFTIYNATELQFLDLLNNLISGELSETIRLLQNLEFLNLSDNALAGRLPATLTTLHNLTVVSLKNNYFSGELPGGFALVKVLDISSNLMNGSLPADFGGGRLSYLNVSYNRLSGPVPPEFASKIPGNATIDLSFNNLSGENPNSSVFFNQKGGSFDGNLDLFGEPTRNPCPIPSSPSYLTNASTPSSTPAVAAIPKTIGPSSTTTAASSSTGSRSQTGLGPGTIVGIVVGDVAGIIILAIIFLYVYRLKKQKSIESTAEQEANIPKDSWSTSSSESRGFTRWSCLRKRGEHEEESESSTSENEYDPEKMETQRRQQNKEGTLVTIDGAGKELELEALLKASAYILGASGSSIIYKAVLEDGTMFAVRRIGENPVERFRDFENQVRAIGKLVHPNLVRIRGFYWGVEEKLIIYDFVVNGSLANARYRKMGSSPCHLPWEARLKIAKGVARGLSFLHERKHVHGNLKPSNILLGPDMEPKIGDFGLENFVKGEMTSKTGGSARNFGSKRSTTSRDSFQDFKIGSNSSPSPSSSSIENLSSYHALESFRSLKPNLKWDVYSYGVILLELLTGKVTVVDELGQGNNGLVVEDKNRALRMADVSIRADVEGKEEALLACFKLGYSCASPVPQKRPTMKEVLQVLDKIPCSSSS